MEGSFLDQKYCLFVWRYNGVSDGTRTHGHWGHNPVLCQLSYTHHLKVYLTYYIFAGKRIFCSPERNRERVFLIVLAMLTEDNRNLLFRQIPSVDLLLESAPIKRILLTIPRSLVLRAIREVLDSIRGEIERAQIADKLPDLELNNVVDQIVRKVAILSQPALGHVINATGVVVHTNLGRSLLAKAVVERFNC